MAQCIACKAEIAVYDHFCPKCGADVARGSVRASSDRQQARLCHLLALLGMLICCIPLNIVLPLMYWKSHEESRTIRRHATEVLNFQLLWSAVLAPLFFLSFVSDIMLWPFVWFGGMVMVLFLAYEAGNGGDGRYLVRIPLFK